MPKSSGIPLIEKPFSMRAVKIRVVRVFLLRSCFCLVFPLILLWASVSSASEPKSLNALLGSVLSRHVDDGYVDYPAISTNPRFARYLKSLEGADKSIHDSKKEHLAFWINVYNAIAIKNIIEGGSTLSPVGRVVFFRLNRHRVGGRNLNLNDVKDLVMSYADPRAHFGMSDTTYSSPSLLAGSYRQASLDEQLQRAAVNFINDKRKNRFSRNLLEAKLSPVFEENIEVFGNEESSILQFIAKFLRDEGMARTLKAGGYSVQFMKHEWSVNGRPMD